MNHWVQISCAIAWNLFAAGPIFGFAALKPILVSQGVYADVCKAHEFTCVDQDMKLNFMFTVAAGLTNMIALVVGFILDNRGPRLCGYIGSAFLALGAMLFANSEKIHVIDPYLWGYSSLAIGGPFVFISTFQLTNAAPAHSGKILAAITGAFDASSALFMFYRVYYENVVYVSLKTFFTGYLVVPLFIVLCEAFIMPSESYLSLGAAQKLNLEGLDEEGNLPEGVSPQRVVGSLENPEEIMHRHNSQSQAPADGEIRASPSHRSPSRVDDRRRKSVLEQVVGERLELKTQGLYGILHGQGVRKQLASPWFTLLLALTVVCMIRINYFMATVRSQETYLVGVEPGIQLGSVFDIALPIGGLIAVPFIGIVLDTLPTLTVLNVMSIISVLIGVLGLFPSFVLNLVGILLLVVYRPFYYTVISDFCTKVFGFETFGTVYGLLMTISGVFNMAQALIDRLTQSVFQHNPTPLNAVMTTLTAVLAWMLLAFATKATKSRFHQIFSDESTALLAESAVV